MTIRDLIPWRRKGTKELAPMVSLQRDINHWFDDFFRSGGMFKEWEGFPKFPELDIAETEKFVDVTAEVPGLTDKDIKLQLSDDGEWLTVEGEKREETETKSEDVVRSERRYGKFRRVVALPSPVDGASVEATCKDGVLRVHMNRLPASQQTSRQIPIKTA